MTGVYKIRNLHTEKDTQIIGTWLYNIEIRTGVIVYNQGLCEAPVKLGVRFGMDSLLAPSEGAWSCLHLGFELLASRVMKQFNSVLEATMFVIDCCGLLRT